MKSKTLILVLFYFIEVYKGILELRVLIVVFSSKGPTYVVIFKRKTFVLSVRVWG